MKRIFIILIVFSIQLIEAQQKQDLQRANKFYAKTYYSEAIPLFEQIASSGQTVDVIEKLANCYFFTNNYKKAQEQYEKIILGERKNISEEYYFRYSETLKAIGNYKEANKIMRNYWVSTKNKVALENYDKDCNTLKNVSAIGSRFEIKNLALNTVNSEFGGVILNDNFIFAAVKKKPSLFDQVYKWNNETYLNLVSIPIKNINSSDSIVNYFSKELKSPLHESSAIFTKDGKTMYFTRNNSNQGKREVNKDKVSNIQIYKAELIGNTWGNIQSLPFNSPDYSVEHPALSLDEKTLYFASDMPGTLGSFDIFSVSINGSNYGKPINLGKKINSPKREQFPFVAADNKLYFSSDGREGYGSLDIYVSDIQNNLYTEASNVGIPVNSGYDDFAFYVNSDAKTGYFSSNRPGGKGNDDIYSFKETKPLIIEDCKQYITGIITDSDSHLALDNAAVTLKNGINVEIEKVNTAQDGKFSFTVACELGYTLFVTKENYSQNTKGITTSGERYKTNDGSMSIRTLESIKKEEEIALEKKRAADLLAEQQLKAAELAKAEQKRIADALALKEKQIAEENALKAKRKAEELALNAKREAEILALKEKKIAEEIAIKNKKEAAALALKEKELAEKNKAVALEAKRLADIEKQKLIQKEKLESEQKQRKLDEINNKSKSEAILVVEKDIIKQVEGRLLINSEHFYFDYNLWYLRKDSRTVLDRVVVLLTKYPDMVVEIGTHTDNRGNEKYNLELSQKRADSSVDYIVKHGISRNRTVAKGYGESKPIIKCVPEDSCDEEQHELNRRNEIEIKRL